MVRKLMVLVVSVLLVLFMMALTFVSAREPVAAPGDGGLEFANCVREHGPSAIVNNRNPTQSTVPIACQVPQQP